MSALAVMLVLGPLAVALAWRRPPDPDAATAEALDRLLPQLQCGQCGFAACRPFAEALAGGHAGVHDCLPGGDPLARRLAVALGVAADRRAPRPAAVPSVARVVEQDCIGCTRCLKVCPVDAIVGAPGMLHGVLEARCTGCALCLPVCPTDCIVLERTP